MAKKITKAIDKTAVIFADEDQGPMYNDCSSNEEFSRAEKAVLSAVIDESDRLPYPIKAVKLSIGVLCEMYEIPAKDKAKVFKKLYPFTPVPAMNKEMYCLHEGKTFKVKEYGVLRENNRNFIVSPFYTNSGGMVIDWVEPYNLPTKDDREKCTKYTVA